MKLLQFVFTPNTTSELIEENTQANLRVTNASNSNSYSNLSKTVYQSILYSALNTRINYSVKGGRNNVIAEFVAQTLVIFT